MARPSKSVPVAAFFIGGGVAHLTFARKFFEDIVPPWLPASKETVNTAAGVAEITGGVLALVPGAERPARAYLIALLLAVFPANVHMAVKPQDSAAAKRTPPALLWARLPVQALMIAWVLRALRDDAT